MSSPATRQLPDHLDVTVMLFGAPPYASSEALRTKANSRCRRHRGGLVRSEENARGRCTRRR